MLTVAWLDKREMRVGWEGLAVSTSEVLRDLAERRSVEPDLVLDKKCSTELLLLRGCGAVVELEGLG